jgi:hypothetical protein
VRGDDTDTCDDDSTHGTSQRTADEGIGTT